MTFHRYQLFRDPSPHFPSPPKWYLPLLSLLPTPSASTDPAALPSRHLPNPSKSLHGPRLCLANLSSCSFLTCSWGSPPSRPPSYPGPPGLCTCQETLKTLLASRDFSFLGGLWPPVKMGQNLKPTPNRDPATQTPGLVLKPSSRPSPDLWKFPEGFFWALRMAD